MAGLRGLYVGGYSGPLSASYRRISRTVDRRFCLGVQCGAGGYRRVHRKGRCKVLGLRFRL
jgi:hypothetical protein